MSGAAKLLERGAELSLLDRLIAAAASGAGRLVLVEGSAGVGKSTLLAVARERAARAGMRALSARGGELERELPFGVVRQLFEGVVVRAPEGEREQLLSGAARLAAPALVHERPAGGEPSAVVHGLYWLCADLAERAPLALVIDDAHWADADSLRWLAYLSRRLEALPLLVLFSRRSGEPALDRSLSETLADEPRVERLALQPLSGAATTRLVRRALGYDTDMDFCRACHEATQHTRVYGNERRVGGRAMANARIFDALERPP